MFLDAFDTVDYAVPVSHVESDRMQMRITVDRRVIDSLQAPAPDTADAAAQILG